ncbi:lasso peptide biosynthesis PqqD family chaperone [Streptomyces kunmingensis]|uniref:Lasso peptide biosynthesis PqqD family chaperone n=1 Tax=Streptomyces kunmingensis TaxID=68225 RepID=A0ABU6CQL4_9ACTN|nr:lasso peptide biosynthesis PqqD family chaperone [Streptomyces kunmingensis]MEB3966215.1 lasso peptide biosynthesis PqqD family chaperone [Streptomyces kunmingensis]
MRLRDGIAVTSTDFGGVLLDQRAGTYWQLNESGTVVVTALADGLGTQEAVERLVAAFDVDRAQAEADVAELTRQLVDARMATP